MITACELMRSEEVYERHSPDKLRRFRVECFLMAGIPLEHAELIADHLILANLRRVNSHG